MSSTDSHPRPGEGQAPEHVRSRRVGGTVPRTRPSEPGPRDCPSGLLGAIPTESGATEFRVWAPSAQSIAVEIEGATNELAGEGEGFWACELTAVAGDDYRLVLDGREPWPDPCSRCQPEGVRGRSRLLDTAAFEIALGPVLGFDELVARLLRLRRELEIRVDESARTLVLRRGAATLRVDFANETVELNA